MNGMIEEQKIKAGCDTTSHFNHDQMVLRVHGYATTLKTKDVKKLRAVCDKLLSETCPDHPTYKAVRKPTAECAKCIALYNRRKSGK